MIPNAIVRSKGDKTTYFGHQLARCRDYSALHYRLPFEKVRYQIAISCGQICYRPWKRCRVIWWTGMHKKLFGTACYHPRF